ncbi:MAG: MAPEG family protein [Gammaproteobacteria bacterium]
MAIATELQGPVLVTVGYFLLWYYLLIAVQRRTKYGLQARYQAMGKEFDRYFGQDEEMLAADRVVANTLEQMGPFLGALWLFAVFVSPTQATFFGAAYVALRFCYPLLLGKKLSKMQPKTVYWCTFPCYLIIFTLLGRVVWTMLG